MTLDFSKLDSLLASRLKEVTDEYELEFLDTYACFVSAISDEWRQKFDAKCPVTTQRFIQEFNRDADYFVKMKMPKFMTQIQFFNISIPWRGEAEARLSDLHRAATFNSEVLEKIHSDKDGANALYALITIQE